MVSLAAALIALSMPSADGQAAPDPNAAARQALARGHYPWYDADKDEVATVAPPKPPTPATSSSGSWSWGDGLTLPSIGQAIAFVALIVLLALLIGALAWAWARFAPDPETIGPRRRDIAELTARTASLPAGLAVDTDDPWGVANRLRASGDLSGAVLHLFVFELLLLDRLGLVRLAPGRTARQLVRSVAELAVRRRVEPTLRLFEAAFYGHQPPGPAAFAVAWAEAEALRQWAAGQGASV